MRLETLRHSEARERWRDRQSQLGRLLLGEGEPGQIPAIFIKTPFFILSYFNIFLTYPNIFMLCFPYYNRSIALSVL